MASSTGLPKLIELLGLLVVSVVEPNESLVVPNDGGFDEAPNEILPVSVPAVKFEVPKLIGAALPASLFGLRPKLMFEVFEVRVPAAATRLANFVFVGSVLDDDEPGLAAEQHAHVVVEDSFLTRHDEHSHLSPEI